MKTTRSSAIIYLSAGAAALCVLATGIYFLKDRNDTSVAVSLPSGLQTPISQRQNTLSSTLRNTGDSEQIELAMSAYSAGKLVAPAGENAFEYYLAALQSNPGDVGAEEAIMELVPVAMSALESAMAANTTLEVERLIPLLERADPGAARVAALKQRWQANVANLANANLANIGKQATASAQAASGSENVQPPILVPENSAPEIAAMPTPAVTAPKVVPKPALAANLKLSQPVQASPKVATAQVQTRAVENRVVEARALSTARVVFPAQARRQKIEGWVDLQVVVDASGRVTEASVIGAQPARIFDVEARRAVMRWRYSPKRVNDQPVSSVLRQRIKFSLAG